MSVSEGWRVGCMHQSACTPWRRGAVSFLYDVGTIPHCAQHHRAGLDTQVFSPSFIIALVLEQELTLNQRHLCGPENGCALSFPPPRLSRADLCPGRSFLRCYFWSFERRGPCCSRTCPARHQPRSSWISSDGPAAPEQALRQPTYGESAAHPPQL